MRDSRKILHSICNCIFSNRFRERYSKFFAAVKTSSPLRHLNSISQLRGLSLRGARQQLLNRLQTTSHLLAVNSDIFLPKIWATCRYSRCCSCRLPPALKDKRTLVCMRAGLIDEIWGLLSVSLDNMVVTESLELFEWGHTYLSSFGHADAMKSSIIASQTLWPLKKMVIFYKIPVANCVSSADLRGCFHRRNVENSHNKRECLIQIHLHITDYILHHHTLKIGLLDLQARFRQDAGSLFKLMRTVGFIRLCEAHQWADLFLATWTQMNWTIRKCHIHAMMRGISIPSF